MEDYNLLERLGKGGQASVYLAENLKEEGKKYVLKKVECFDESEANKAFNEALALQKLEHPYICGYKEFFVMWDKQESSMFLCIVMDYYSKGDLRSIISSYQQQKIAIPENTLRKYFGEILEALIYCHRQGIIHRDLKPSNIFVRDDNMLCLGDFGVSTVMGDLRTCPRNTAGTVVYMAPEVMEQAFDERSDVWSLGCMVLEMMTTSFFSQQEISAKLVEIKKDAYILEDVYDEIAKNFSNEWIKMIQTMLKVKHEARPTAEALLKMSFVLNCMEATNSSLLDKRMRQHQTVNRIRPLKDGKDNPEQIIQYIADTIDHEDCVKEGLEALRVLLEANAAVSDEEASQQPPILLDQASKNLITLAMWDNMASKDVQLAGCAVLTSLIINEGDGFSKADSGDILFTPEALSVVGKVMKEHKGSPDVQQMAAGLILALSANNRASYALVKLGALQDLLSAMRDNPDNVGLIATCCNALWGLNVFEDNLKVSAELKAVEEVSLALQKHIKSPEVVEAAAAALVSLCLDDGCFDTVCSMDCVGSLLMALEIHIKRAKIVKNILVVLTTLIEPNEECAYRLLTSDKPDDESHPGIPIIIKAYELHRDNAEVVEAVVCLIMELCEYDDVNAEMRHFVLGSNMLSEIYKHYKENKDIMEPCENALDKLGASKVTVKKSESANIGMS